MVSETIHGLWWRRPGRARCSLQSLTAPLPFTTTKSRKEKISFANIPSVLRTAFFCINVIGGAFAANMQMCQLCWKRVQETMPNSARLKVEEEGITEPGGS